jgi:formylglycine-generating enzyme required for sulfatase activity
MRRWFLSYHSQDGLLAEALERELRRKDPSAAIFFAPKALRPGAYWMPALVEAIAQATGFVLLVGPNGLGPWQTIEYYEAYDRRAKERDFPLVLVLIEGQPAPGLPFLRQLHWIVTADPASEKSVAQLLAAANDGGAPPGELWRHTAPYRGLAAMTETDADFFFGRGRETAETIGALAAAPDRLALLIGNSGVGKSSLAQAGVIAALMRQAWPEADAPDGPWPQAFGDARRWCFLKLNPGTEPVRALVEPFLRTWQFDAVDPARARLLSDWTANLVAGSAGLRDLLDATEARYCDDLKQLAPPAFLLYIDQGEELYLRAEERQRRRFSELVVAGLGDRRLRAMMSLRADFFGELQKDEALHSAHRLIDVPPLREAALRTVVDRPASLLQARFESERLAADIARRTAEDSATDAGALPLLSYLLDDMWTRMVERGDGVLRLPAQAIDLGDVLVERGDAFLSAHPNREDAIKRILTLKLATVREDGEPARRRALRSEFSDDEWRLVGELADHPNRLVVTAVPEGGEAYAEIAHEAVFRRWDTLRNWITEARDFLIWKSTLEADRRAWDRAPDGSKSDALLMGLKLAQAQGWLARRAGDLERPDKNFIGLSVAREARAQRRAHRRRVLTYALLAVVILGLVGWMNQAYLKDQALWVWTVRPYRDSHFRPYALTKAQEQALKPGAGFRECASDADCPTMIVVPPGKFLMGSLETETETIRHLYGFMYNTDSERPQHPVTVARPFAVGQYDVTFAEWDVCVKLTGCPAANDSGFGRGTRPVINVSWYDAESYVTWLSRMTGRAYRLLSEAEWEYAARAGTTTAYYWGDDIGKNNAHCSGCGSQWDSTETAPVGSFKPNAFGLYDMAGNVYQWAQDCWHVNYFGAPQSGAVWEGGNCNTRVIHGGSWINNPQFLRAAYRDDGAADGRSNVIGFRVARTIAP